MRIPWPIAEGDDALQGIVLLVIIVASVLGNLFKSLTKGRTPTVEREETPPEGQRPAGDAAGELRRFLEQISRPAGEEPPHARPAQPARAARPAQPVAAPRRAQAKGPAPAPRIERHYTAPVTTRVLAVAPDARRKRAAAAPAPPAQPTAPMAKELPASAARVKDAWVGLREKLRRGPGVLVEAVVLREILSPALALRTSQRRPGFGEGA
jgi:hypothetical protein